MYHVYDLALYVLLYALPAAGIHEVKMSGQYLVLLEEPRDEQMTLRLLSAPLGQVSNGGQKDARFCCNLYRIRVIRCSNYSLYSGNDE